MYPIVVDNFFEDPDSIRNYALNLQYRNPNSNKEKWLGYRSFTKCENLKKNILLKIKKYNQNITKIQYYFHFSLLKTKETSPYAFDEYKIHKDPCQFAGIIYLYPEPPKNTGLSFYNNNLVFIHSIENIYNRFILYPGDIFHSPTNLFGDNKENGRLTLTVFCN